MFKQQLRDSLRRETSGLRAIKIAKHTNIYNCGEKGATVYFIESGQVKLVTVSVEGKECCRGCFRRDVHRRIRRTHGNSDGYGKDGAEAHSLCHTVRASEQ